MALCTQSDVERFGGVDFTNDPDASVTLWIASATAAIETYCGRPLEREAGREEKFTPNGVANIYLDLYPLDTVTSVTEDGTALTVDDDYLVDTKVGKITRVTTSGYAKAWRPYGKLESIVVTYTAGYADGDATNDIPGDLRQACAVAVGDIFRASQAWADSGGAEGVSVDQIGSVDYPSAEAATYSAHLSPQVKDLLEGYRALAFA